ncbi:nuclear transport factor 2 family protein [Isosphaeraceae bacterium EP7]
MIRSMRTLAIGMALIGAHNPTGYCQESGRPPEAEKAKTSPAQTGPAGAAAPASSPTAAAEKAVRETVAAYVATYNQKDATKLAAFFTENGELIDSENVATSGREAITQEFSDAFAEQSPYTLKADIERVRQITPEVAKAEGVARLVAPRESTIAKRFVAVLARQGDAWKIDEIRDYPAPADSLTPYERLKELEWMIGEWVDESDEVQVSTTVRWGQGKAYLIRDYNVQVKGKPSTSGLMVIAWDPQTHRIRSWIFNADGSRGGASWTRATDNQWVVKAHGSTADGQSTSATQVISLVNKDAMRTSSTDRIIGDEIAGDLDEIIMVRKPLPPGATAAPLRPATPTSAPR